MTIDGLDALVRAELDRKKNPENKQERQSRAHPALESTPRVNNQQMPRNRRHSTPNIQGRFRRGLQTPCNGSGVRKKCHCYYCGKPGHFKKVCRKRIADVKACKSGSRRSISTSSSPVEQERTKQRRHERLGSSHVQHGSSAE